LNIAEYIRNRIDRLPKGYIFTYEDFDADVKKKEAIVKALNRMVETGKISKLAKGKLKPKITIFNNEIIV